MAAPFGSRGGTIPEHPTPQSPPTQTPSCQADRPLSSDGYDSHRQALAFSADYPWLLRRLVCVCVRREVGAEEALAIGLANRVVPPGMALQEAQHIAAELSTLPQACMRADREATMRQWGASEGEALHSEWAIGRRVLDEARAGAGRFSRGEGRGGSRL